MDWISADDYVIARLVLQRGRGRLPRRVRRRRSTSSGRCWASAGCCRCRASCARCRSGRRRACSSSATPTGCSRSSAGPGCVLAAAWCVGLPQTRAALGADARLARAVGAVPVDRQRRPDVLRVRLGVAAAGGRLPARSSSATPTSRRRLPVLLAAALAAVPARVRRRAHQAARRPRAGATSPASTTTTRPSRCRTR